MRRSRFSSTAFDVQRQWDTRTGPCHALSEYTVSLRSHPLLS